MKTALKIIAIMTMTMLIVGMVSAVTIPSCDFTANTVSGPEDLTVTFTATYDGITPPVTYSWDFGDGTGAEKVSGASVTHTYFNPGKYTVRLAVNDLGVPTTWWVSNTKTEYITVTNTPPVVSISATPTSGPADLTVEFSSTVTGEGITGYVWNFGDGHYVPHDGSDAILPSASNTYELNGTYTATLTVTNDGGSGSDSVVITVYPELPVADFVANPRLGQVPLAVQFSDTTNHYAYANSWDWSFGDGQHSTEQNPLHAYGTVGLKTVSLTVSNGYNTDTETKTAYINVTAENPMVCPVCEICPEPEEEVTVADNVGVFRPSNGNWYLTDGFDGIVDTWFHFGRYDDVPVTGDYNGDGITDAAVFRTSTGYWYFDYGQDGTVDQSFKFGIAGDVPVSGDFNNDGTDGIGVFRPVDGDWFLDTNLDGTAEQVFHFGKSGDIPVIGNWGFST